VDFRLSEEQQRLQQKCRELAADFAIRSAQHDRDASHPIENYQRLRDEGFLALTVARKWGGAGASFLDHTIAYEALGQGCPYSWAAAVEHYADFGRLSHFEPLTRQYQTLFAVIDYRGEPVNVEFGIGHGFTAASDALIIKLIVSRNF